MAYGLNLNALYESNPELVGKNIYGMVIEENPPASSWLCCINSKWKTEECENPYIGNAAEIIKKMNDTGKKVEPYVVQYKYITKKKDSPGEFVEHREEYSVNEIDMGNVFYAMKGVELGRVFGKYNKVYTNNILDTTDYKKSIDKADSQYVIDCIGERNNLNPNYYFGVDTFANELLINGILCDKLKEKNLDDFVLKIKYYSMCNKWGVVATDYHPLLDFGFILKEGGGENENILFKRRIELDQSNFNDPTYIGNTVDSKINDYLYGKVNSKNNNQYKNKEEGKIILNMLALEESFVDSIVLQLLMFLYVTQKNFNFHHGDLTVENIIISKEPKEYFKKSFLIESLDKHNVEIESLYKIKVTGFKYSSLTFENKEKIKVPGYKKELNYKNLPEKANTLIPDIKKYNYNRDENDNSIDEYSENFTVRIRLFNLYKYNFTDSDYFKSLNFNPKIIEQEVCTGVGLSKTCSGKIWWKQGGNMWWAPGKNLLYVTQHTGLPYHRAYDFYTFMLSLALSENGFGTIFSNSKLRVIWKIMWLPQEYDKMTYLIFRLRNAKNPEFARIKAISQYLTSVHLNCSIIIKALEIMSDYVQTDYAKKPTFNKNY